MVWMGEWDNAFLERVRDKEVHRGPGLLGLIVNSTHLKRWRSRAEISLLWRILLIALNVLSVYIIR